MSFETEAAKLSRHPFWIVKLELDASISPGGSEYHCSGRPPLGYMFHPSINDNGIDTSPTRMGIGAGFGRLGRVTINFQDFTWGENGTYWAKLFAENPYRLDRKLKLYTGFYDGKNFDWNNFREQLYFIKKVTGPNSTGRVTIQADDPLTLINPEQSSTPTAPNAKLFADITATQTGTINITDNTDFEATGGIVDLDGEFARYTATSGADSLVVSERGVYGSKSDEHSEGDQVSPCYDFDKQNAVDVIRNLIDKFTPIPIATYVDSTDWDFQRDEYLFGAIATGVIKAGQSIKTEIESLCKNFYISVFFDTEEQKAKLVPIGPLVTAARRITIDKNIFSYRENKTEDQTKIVTQTRIYYGRRNHYSGETDKNNYKEWLIVDNGTTAAQVGKDLVREVYAQYIPEGGASSANNLAAKINKQFVLGLIKYECTLDAIDSDIKVGDIIEVFSPVITGTDGLPVPTSFICIERDHYDGSLYHYKFVRTGFALGSKYRLIAPNTMSGVTYTTATDEQKAKYLFICGNNGEFSNADAGHCIL